MGYSVTAFHSVLEVVTVDDLIRAGACYEGVMTAYDGLGTDPTAAFVSDLPQDEWLTKASKIDGYGNGNGDRNGDGNGYGYGYGDGDGYGDGNGNGYGYGYGYGCG